MHHTFTGSSRRPRQVNLSGRNPNPFATFGNQTKSPGSHNALASAQQDRLARQQERERQKAATSIQRMWRGHNTRKTMSDQRRSTWDGLESHDSEDAMDTDSSEDAQPYQSEQEALERAKLLLTFVNPRQKDDVSRIHRLYRRLQSTIGSRNDICTASPWAQVYVKLEEACLKTIERSPPEVHSSIWDVLKFTTRRIPTRDLSASISYYHALAKLAGQEDIDVDIAVEPLQHISKDTIYAYQGFIELLTVPRLGHRLLHASIDSLAGRINCKLLSSAVSHSIRDRVMPFESLPQTSSKSSTKYAWLLAHLIYFYRHAHGFSDVTRYVSDVNFVFSISTLLSAMADDIRLEAVDSHDHNAGRSFSADSWVRDQIVSLLNQETIGGLLSRIGPDSGSAATAASSGSEDMTQVLASFILTLLRLFPRRADEIRMWLYLGNTKSESSSNVTEGISQPVIKLFWNATRQTQIFKNIVRDPKAAVTLLRPKESSLSAVDKEWRVIFIFIELYLFILKIMDDEEFFSGSRISSNQSMNARIGLNTLPLEDIEAMVTFLKHLGFTMYYNAPDILDSGEDDQNKDISSLFRSPTASAPTSGRSSKVSYIAGIHGVTLDYLKGLVTGLLRAVYERDSRRPFLPKGHWLMTSRFDMTNFIDAVVEEEERRSQVQEEDEEDGLDDEVDDRSSPGAALSSTPTLVGTGHAQRLQRIEFMQRQQRKASRKRYLQAVAPRLEILQNMPFLIPFTTRVQIFRRFVVLDQIKRRNGILDAEEWRLINGHQPFRHPLDKHQANIRREYEFDDAFEQFWDLGSSLKEPIQITFVDQFGEAEAGIDGGGVTKEFLTSVTNQVFTPHDGINMFAENEQHLLYPNPSAVEEQKEMLKEVGFKETSPTYKEQVATLLRKYEFLGRIIGKCLYEGILIDIGFAGFFLLKWALTGGAGSAPRETGYRANLNDLRDLDEGLYQGLLQLKNYPGDVEDFSLNFTVTDTVTVPSTNPKQPPKTKTMTLNLMADGANVPVTNANRLVYISYMARHRLSSQPYAQTMSFLKGLSAIIQPSWLSMFNQAELQTLIGGAPAEIDVADLRRNTIYGGVYVIGDDGQEHESVKIFWDVMQEIDDADRRKVLKFVTSTPRAPLLGFASLNPKFCLRDAGADQTRLPSTSTCVNLLKLPRFTTKQACKTKLLQAVNSGAGFDLS